MSYTTFFYDQQIRRFLIQFIRAMSNFQVRIGIDDNGGAVYQRVPVFYGDANRQASQILRSNSENALPSVPAMAVYLSGMTYDRDRVQDPTFVSKINIRKQEYNEETGTYTGQQGGVYTIERLMPVPYKLEVKLDIWSSNFEQKLMLVEQIVSLFNPAIEIQNTDNYIDWTSLTYIILVSQSLTSRSIPVGTDDPIDIATLTFDLPIWISAPAKVKQLGVIRKIVTSIYDDNGTIDENIFREDSESSGAGLLDRNFLTFANFGVVLRGNTLRLVQRTDLVNSTDTLNETIVIGKQHSWNGLVNQYGTLRAGLSQIRLMQENGSEVVGTIAFHPTDDSLLLFTPDPDTFPNNTLAPVNAIINPTNVDVESKLLTPAAGTRYLLTQRIGTAVDDQKAPAWNPGDWPELIANANDIVEFNGVYWIVAFDSKNENKVEYVTNMTTGIQYKWANQSWSKSVEGKYPAEDWSLVL